MLLVHVFIDVCLIIGQYVHNFGDGKTEEILFLDDYQDSFFLEKNRCLDRVYLSSDCLRAQSIRLVGKHSVKTDLNASDHFGLLATISESTIGCQNKTN